MDQDEHMLIENAPLLGEKPITFGTVRLRFYVLFIFAITSFLQSMNWMTFSSVPDAVSEYYPGITNGTIDLLLNWGPIAYIPSVPVGSWMCGRVGGLRAVQLTACTLMFLGAAVRTIPCWLSVMFRGSGAVYFLHVGQILNALAGPFVMASVSKFSVTWFGDGERTLATACCVLANNLGSTIGFLIGPFIVVSASQLPLLLYIEVGVAAAITAVTWIYFPAMPHIPPSPAAAQEGKHNDNFLRGTLACCRNVSFVLLATAGGFQAGAFGAWTGVLPIVFSALDYTPQSAGMFTSGCMLAGVVGGLIVSRVCDTLLRRRFKRVILMGFLLSLAAFLWFTLSLPVGPYAALLPHPLWMLGIAIVLAGLFLGGITPLFYELGAELTFPVSEGTSAGLLTLMLNLGALIFLAAGAYIDPMWMNLIMTSVVCVCLVMTVFVREKYVRSDSELKGGIVIQ